MSRIERRFAHLKQEGRAGLVAYLVAGDPDPDTSLALFEGGAEAGADLIEIGMPFSDPMADGPSIQAAGQRALKAGMTLRKTFAMVRHLRPATPIRPRSDGLLQPDLSLRGRAFARDAVAAGVDGAIIVDLPPEEDAELAVPARAAGLAIVRLATPTSDEARLPAIVGHAGGFLYYVAIAGITGTRSADAASVHAAVARLRRFTELPIAVGFGIKTPAQAAEVARPPTPRWSAPLWSTAWLQPRPEGNAKPGLVDAVLADIRALAAGCPRRPPELIIAGAPPRYSQFVT